MEFIILIIIGIVIYFLPSIVAYNRNHNQYNPILLLNLFLGWTVIGWIAALIWAVSNPPRR